jgi:drug/metabolite transporter (DMT)-like permease
LAPLLEANQKEKKCIMLSSVFHAFGALFLNFAYIEGSVNLVQLIKCLEPVTTYLLSVGMLNATHSLSVFFSVVTVVFGAGYATRHDASYNVTSVVIALVSNFMMPLRNVMFKVILQSNDSIHTTTTDAKHSSSNSSSSLEAANIFALISAIGSLWIGILAVLYATFTQTISSLFQRGDIIANISMSSVMFFSYNGASFAVLSLTDAVTHSLLNVFKRFVSIVGNAFLLHTGFTMKTAVGTFISFLGMIQFTLLKQKSRKTNVMVLGFILLSMISSTIFMSDFSVMTMDSTMMVEQKNFDPSWKLWVVPFQAYKMNSNNVTVQRTCEITLIMERRTQSDGRYSVLQWSDQPFETLDVDDIDDVSLNIDHMMCLQVGSSVGALVVELNNGERIFLAPSPNHTDHILNKVKNHDMNNQDNTDFKVIERKTIGMTGMYKLTSPEARQERSHDPNTGNFVWMFGATRMINPYTVIIQPLTIHEADESILAHLSALVVASANALHIPLNPDYKGVKNYLVAVTNLIRRVNKPTTVLGIGIQAQLSDLSNVDEIELHGHQATFMHEVARRGEGKSVSVRGEMTETACKNAGIDICNSLGCPSLTISRNTNLGNILKKKWQAVVLRLSRKEKVKLAIAVPAFQFADVSYARVMEKLFSICKEHDCTFFMQANYDQSQLLKYAVDSVNEGQIVHFKEDVEVWFEFISKFDFMVSTRIHGGMSAIVNEVPTIILPTDYRIMELVNAMKLPHIPVDIVLGKEPTFKSLMDVINSVEPNFDEFERTRLHHLIEYKIMLENIGLEMDPALVNIINHTEQ